MTDYPPPGSSFPPPGEVPPPPAPAPAYAAPSPAPGSWGGPPVAQPGAVPLRPLTLGDIFDSSFKIIRHNASATLAPALIVATVGGLISVLISLAFADSVQVFTQDPASMAAADLADVWAFSLVSLLGSIPQTIAMIVVTAMISPVVAGAAQGHKLTLRQAWEATEGKRGKAIGLAILSFLIIFGVIFVIVVVTFIGISLAVAGDSIGGGILAGTIGFCAMFLIPWIWVRVTSLSVPALMLEDIRVGDAFRRSIALTRHQFWRILGIVFLVGLATSVVGSLLAAPTALINVAAAGVSQEVSLVMFTASQALAGIIIATIQTPFVATTQNLLYLDQRFRKEGLDIAMMTQAGQR